MVIGNEINDITWALIATFRVRKNNKSCKRRLGRSVLIASNINRNYSFGRE